MNDHTISIFDNKIFFQIISEMKLFSKFKILHYEDINLCVKDAKNGNYVVVFFTYPSDEIKTNDFPSIIIANPSEVKKKFSYELQNQLKRPFKIIDFKTNPYPYFKLADIFVLSSIFEGLPNVLLEAMQLKKYIISSNCPTGPKEILKNGKYGYLFPMRNVNYLSKSIREFKLNFSQLLK